MVVTLDEMKKYLRVDFEDDDVLLRNIMESAQTLCMDVARITDGKAQQPEQYGFVPPSIPVEKRSVNPSRSQKKY